MQVSLIAACGTPNCTTSARVYRVIRYDTRGFGKSRTENTQFSNRQDIVDLFTHLGVEKGYCYRHLAWWQIAIDFTLGTS